MPIRGLEKNRMENGQTDRRTLRIYDWPSPEGRVSEIVIKCVWLYNILTFFCNTTHGCTTIKREVYKVAGPSCNHAIESQASITNLYYSECFNLHNAGTLQTLLDGKQLPLPWQASVSHSSIFTLAGVAPLKTEPPHAKGIHPGVKSAHFQTSNAYGKG